MYTPYAFLGGSPFVAPFSLSYDKKTTNAGSTRTSERNGDLTYDPDNDWWVITARGGSTQTYTFQYDYDTDTQVSNDPISPGYSNEGIAYVSSNNFIMTKFQSTGGSKPNPTDYAFYEFNSTNNRYEQDGGNPNLAVDDSRDIAYNSITGEYYVIVPDQNKVYVYDSNLTNTSNFPVAGFANEAGIGCIPELNMILVVNRDPDGSGNNFFKSYSTVDGTFEETYILSGSDMGSYFRIGGIANDSTHRRLCITHNNSSTGGTANKSEAWFYNY